MVIFLLNKNSLSSFFNKREQGQVLLVIVLLMVIVLTIGLSLATRSITNVRQAADEDSSQRAFSAAEAGVEVALKETDVNLHTFNGDLSGTTYKATADPISAEAITLNTGNDIQKNESIDIWLSDYPTYGHQWSGTLTLFWGKPADTSCAAALEVTILSGVNINTPNLTHYAYDPCSRGNNFTLVQQLGNSSFRTVLGKEYKYRLSLPAIPVAAPGYLMRIIPLYKSTPFAVTTNVGNPLPKQGRKIEAVGKSGGTQRKIVVEQGNPKLPLEIFPYVLFTPASL